MINKTTRILVYMAFCNSCLYAQEGAILALDETSLIQGQGDPDEIALSLKDSISTDQILSVTGHPGEYSVEVSHDQSQSVDTRSKNVEGDVIKLDLSSIGHPEKKQLLEYLEASNVYGHGEVYFQEGVIEFMELAVEAFYSDRGSVLAKVSIGERERNNNELILELAVQDQGLRKIRDVSFQADAEIRLDKKSLLMAAEIKGKIANKVNIEQLQEVVSEGLYEKGHVRHHIEHFYRSSPEGVDLVLSVKNAAQYYFGEVSINGSERFDSERLQRSMAIDEGSLAIFESYKEFGHESRKEELINSLTLSLEYPGPSTVDVDIELQDKNQKDFRGGAYYSTNLGYFVGLNYKYDGVRPIWGGDTAAVKSELKLGEYIDDFKLSYKTAYLRPQGLSYLKIGIRHESVDHIHDLFDYDRQGVQISYQSLLSKSFGVEYFISNDFIDINPDVEYELYNSDYETNYNRLETGVNLHYSINNPLYDNKSFSTHFELGLSHILSNNEDHAAKVTFSNNSIYKSSKTLDFKLKTSVESLKSSGESNYVFDNIFLGGDKLRAFPVGSIGGYSGGQSSFHTEFLISRKVTEQIKLGVFYEIGMVYSSGSLSGAEDRASDYGVMVSMDIPQGALSVYAAFPDSTPNNGRDVNGSNVIGIDYSLDF